LLAHLCETAPGIRLRLHSTDRLFDEPDVDRLELGIAFGPLTEGRAHHKRRRIGADTFLRMFNADRVGVSPPISLDEYLRLPQCSRACAGASKEWWTRRSRSSGSAVRSLSARRASLRCRSRWQAPRS
jgi:DNA-binding transcriptional LysR family regulator